MDTGRSTGGTRTLLSILVVVGILTAGAPLAVASGSSKESENLLQPEAAKSEEAKRVEFGVEMRWRFELRDNADQQPADDFDHFLGQRIRVHLRVQIHSHWSAYVEGQDVWLFGAENDKVVHSLGTNLRQLYLDWKPGGSERWQLRAGRQELIYGEERLVGAFGWDNVGRSFDAARLRYRTGAWSNDFFWARLVDVRRAGARHRPGNQDLSGVYLTRAPKESPRRTELYGFFLRDGQRVAGERGTLPQATRLFTLGVHHLRQPKTGWRYSVEHAWQFGQRGPDRHRAAMLVVSSGYAWNGRWQPRLQLEYDFATGDNNPADGNSREFNNLFPTNHIYYGYADLLGLRNLHALRITAAAQLHPKFTVEADYHRFLLAARRGPWKSATGRVLGFDPTGEAGRDVGQEMDLTFRVPLQKHVSILAGYAVFLPGGFAARTRGPLLHQFGYFQTSISF